MEKELIDQFIRRFAYGKEIKQIDSFGAHSGSPFYFYCEDCGVPTEAFPEQPIVDPIKSCSQCVFLSEKRMLDQAKAVAKKFFGFE
jgi:hypothetical protein